MLTTRARSAWIPQAVRYFLRQTHLQRELIVASDGLPDGLIPTHPEIRHVRVPDGVPLGAKRNLATTAARGEFIAHWDDDDWYAPDRISVQLRCLAKNPERVSGCGSLPFLDVQTGAAWQFHHSGTWPFAFGATLFYARSTWEATPFRPVVTGHDTLWCKERNQPHVTPSQRICVATAHANNTSPRHFDSRYRRIGTLEDVIPKEDRAFYRQFSRGAKDVDPAIKQV